MVALFGQSEGERKEEDDRAGDDLHFDKYFAGGRRVDKGISA